MRTTLYVISGLHLGSTPSSDHNAGFQMCLPAMRELLVNFLDRLSGGSDDAGVRPVLGRERKPARSSLERSLRTLTPWTGETRVCGAWLPFVVEVMNSLNSQCAFADLLKLEDASALPSAASH